MTWPPAMSSPASESAFCAPAARCRADRNRSGPSNTGKSTISNVKVSVQALSGWTTSAASPASFNAIAPGKSETVTYDVTPSATASGGNGLVVNATYNAPDKRVRLGQRGAVGHRAEGAAAGTGSN